MNFIKNPIVHGVIVFVVMVAPVVVGLIPGNVMDMTIGSLVAGVLVWFHGMM